MPYQPIYRDGTIVTPGERASDDRYQTIAKRLRTLKEPFTVLDLGAAEGYFAARLAEDFDCRVTAIDPNPRLPEVASDRVTVINHAVSPANLAKLPRHDVVLALSVVHHFPAWKPALAEIVACHRIAIVEIPDPSEVAWMRMAPARTQLSAIASAVNQAATAQLGKFPRVGRNKKTYQRRIFEIPGRIVTLTGSVFSGSGTCSRKLPQHATGLDAHLGYKPYAGSLNLRTDQTIHFGVPWLDWRGRNKRGNTRDYQFWRAWIGDKPCHAMIPGRRGHGPTCFELVAPVRLRDMLPVVDGDMITVDVEVMPKGPR